ncbi:MAG: NHL repeat-containing protein [Lachnospiraceae bacterium]|nr:NHL repeat-containing protein [Lachnospiraceae bacterium]
MKKRIFCTAKRMAALAMLTMVLTVGSAPAAQTVYADMPYDTYSYNYWTEDVIQPHAYLYTGSLSADDFQTKLNYPEDMFLTEEAVYVADTGNSRVLKLSLTGKVLMEWNTAGGEEDRLSKPQGIFVTEEGHLYVADSGNGRIVEYDAEGAFLRSIGRPVTDLIDSNQMYTPVKLVVDKAGRIYVTAYGINMGLLEFSKEGVFQGFMGAAEVSVNPLEYIWKNYFSTEEQKKRMETIVPTEYSNLFLDKEGFIYATISNLDEEGYLSGADAIRRLNPTGTDILRRLGNYNIIGDLYNSSEDAEWSVFRDVCATGYGCYFILDSAGGKVFAYDYDGNSLFIFGDKGNREGTMRLPAAIGTNRDASIIYVLDSQLGEIMQFEITEYGSHFLGAMEKNNRGDSQGAYEEWQEVLKQNSNCELAYIGLGKTFLKEGSYKKAMEYFELGNSKKYYSTAFYYYRKEIMQDYFSKAMGLVGVIILVTGTVIGVKKFRRWAGEVRCVMEKQ